MSALRELIQKYCPDGVPYQRLGDITSNLDSQRRPVTRSDRRTGPFPYYGANGIQDYVDDFIFDGTFLLIGEDGSVVQNDGSPVINWVTGKVWVNNHAHVIAKKGDHFDLRFLYHYLQTIDITPHVTGGAQPKLNQGNLNRIRIPVPPIEVQEEIVRTLDCFLSLGAELDAELRARRTQYVHYRSSLLAFEKGDEVNWSTLGGISAQVSTGATPLKSRSEYYDHGDIPWLRTQEVLWRDVYDTEIRITEQAVRETAVKWIPENCVIVAISGASAARVAVNKIRLTTNQHCCNLEIDPSKASYRFVFHWVTAHYENLRELGQGARSDLNVSIIKSFPIALPAVAEQVRIAELLDKFDALVNSTVLGLPAEIALRRKQYEYYRDTLLMFEEAAA